MNETVGRITPAQKEKLIRNIWILHEARWFIKCIQKFGFETATELNLMVAESIGKTEIKQLLAEIGHEKVKDIHEFDKLMHIAADVYFPPEHKFRMEIMDDKTYCGKVLDCYVYKNVQKAGTTAIHKCAARLRFVSWAKAFGLNCNVASSGDTPNCNGRCDITFNIRWD